MTGRPVWGSIGVDANVILAASVRRFLCAMQEDTGGKVVVVPQAWNETSPWAERRLRLFTARMHVRPPLFLGAVVRLVPQRPARRLHRSPAT